jgi:hypothetical protein
MAKTVGVWGIDVGRCALKALRCRLDGDSVVADAFDYIEYPKLLNQPEADAARLIKEARAVPVATRSRVTASRSRSRASRGWRGISSRRPWTPRKSPTW